jgi:hypothetical protein
MKALPVKGGLALAAVCLPAFAAGCHQVNRDLTITSEPPGAIVFLHDTEVGQTPVTVPFTWYGDYDIILRKDGWQTLKTHARLTPPWHEVPPLDLLRDLLPGTTSDRRYLHFTLKKLSLPDEATLLRRARELRQRNLQTVRF